MDTLHQQLLDEITPDSKKFAKDARKFVQLRANVLKRYRDLKEAQRNKNTKKVLILVESYLKALQDLKEFSSKYDDLIDRLTAEVAKLKVTFTTLAPRKDYSRRLDTTKTMLRKAGVKDPRESKKVV